MCARNTELLLNDRTGEAISFKGSSLDKFCCTGAQKVSHTGIQNIDLPLHNQKHCPLGYQALLLAAIDFILATALLRSESRKRLLKKEEGTREKSLQKSKNVLEEKRKMAKWKICIKRPTRLQKLLWTSFKSN